MGSFQTKAFCPRCRYAMHAIVLDSGEVHWHELHPRGAATTNLKRCPKCGADLGGVTREDVISKSNWT